MPPRFIRLTLDEFADLLQRFDFTRRIDAVHMHHTWRPNHAQYREESSIEAMWQFHTRENGWRDTGLSRASGEAGIIQARVQSRNRAARAAIAVGGSVHPCT